MVILLSNFEEFDSLTTYDFNFASNLTVIDLSNKRMNVKDYVQSLQDSYLNLISAFHSTHQLPSPNLINAYLDSFLNLSKYCVFNPKNYNLYYKVFRTSSFLNSLLTFAMKKENDDYSVSFFDPFALDALNRGLSCLSLLESEKSAPLLELRRYLLVANIKNSFYRFFTVNRKTYLVSPSDESSSLVARPRENYSSIRGISLAYLLERTVAYIKNNLEEKTNPFYLDICIIGSEEMSRASLERSLLDYLNSILEWYSFEFSLSNKPQFRLRLKIILNNPNIPLKNLTDNPDLTIKKEANSGQCFIEEIDYKKFFAFNSLKLEKEIESNNLIFLLDCPWLGIENYEIGVSSNFDTYCELLKMKKRDTPDYSVNFEEDSWAFHKYSTFRRLSENYNRLTSSETLKAGSVEYIPKNSLITIIRNQLKHTRGELKEFYLFSSSNIEFSQLSTLPTVKTELIDGTLFSVFNFKNSSWNYLELADKNEPLVFSFSLWEIFERLSPSFIDSFFKPLNLPIPIWRLCRNIFVSFIVEKNLLDIRFSVSISDNLNNYFSKTVKDAVLFHTRELVEPLYRDFVFNSNNRYGSDMIREGFIENLYNSASSVDIMFFLHYYERARQEKSLSQFRLTFAEESLPRKERTSLNPDSFLDKKLYASFFSNFARFSELPMGFYTLIKETNELCHSESTSLMKRLASNTVAVCKRYDKEDSFLYYNASKIKHQ